MQTQNAKKEKIETTCSCSLGSTRAVSLYRTLRGNGPSFLMELGDFALLGAKPKKIFQVEGDVTIVTDQDGHTRKLPKEDFFEAVDNYMQEHKVADDELLSFNGGLLGYVGYDIASNVHLSAYPGAFLFEPSVYCALERSTGRIIHCNQTGLFDDAPVEPLQTDDKSANALLAGQLDGKSPVEIESFTPVNIYDPFRTPPVLFSAGNYIRFQAITAEQYQTIKEQAKIGAYKVRTYNLEEEKGML